MSRPSWAPADIDLDRPNPGRVYDYYLGGAHNFAPDRELAQKALRIEPNLRLTMVANRAFLRRVVRFLISAGVTQFIDIGCGIPTGGNVHEIVQQSSDAARVVYVDIDPVAVAHSRAILTDDERTTVVRGDLREPARILADSELRRIVDLDQPVAVLLVGVLHFISDEEDPTGIIDWLYDAIRPNSYIAISHGTSTGRPCAAAHEALYESSGTMIRLRRYAEIEKLVAGLDLVEPGLVFAPLWRPDSPSDEVVEPERIGVVAALAHKAQIR
jgi:SAM-dependent methyltransferase